MIHWEKILEFCSTNNPEPSHRVEKTDEEWQQQLSAEQFQITRKSATERAFSNDTCSLFESGEYHCVCCDNLLFDANSKFESGSGWPSFMQPAKINAIAYRADYSHAMSRVEAICNVCDAHLGHVFPDGPEPSGLRYCMNSLAMIKK
ncbi:MAG: peptide-methionine (R)-S-oxide reductase MsrB [Gammaproteobacteria bacterium]|nr:peptide-methionine (R)-S-oxide reductase MsrB [Gammaproteobacteria bacterium]